MGAVPAVAGPSVVSAQKLSEVIFFPVPRPRVVRVKPLAPVEFFGVNATAAARQRLVRHDGVKHLVIEDVPQKPDRHERLIQSRIDSNYPVFFLDRAKNELLPRAVLSTASPDNFVATKTPAKMSPV